jgi:hypothetical protein
MSLRGKPSFPVFSASLNQRSNEDPGFLTCILLYIAIFYTRVYTVYLIDAWDKLCALK